MEDDPSSGPNGMIAQALDSMSGVERRLFSRSVVKTVNNPRSRLHKWLPKYGVKGATLLIVAGLWMWAVVIGAVIGIIGQFVSGAVEAVGVLLFLSGAFMGYFRIFSAAKAGKTWRAGKSGPSPTGPPVTR